MSTSRDVRPAFHENNGDEDNRNGEKAENGSESSDKTAQNNDENGAKGRDEEQQTQDGPPAPVGFWDHRLKHVRHEAFTKWAVTTVGLMAFILACLSIYWGVFNHVDSNLSSLVVWIVDFDAQVAPYNSSGIEPIVGPTIVQLGQQMVAGSSPSLGYLSKSPADFNYDPLEVRRGIYGFNAWAAIIINPNATAMLLNAVQQGNASYDPRGACQLVYEDARDDTNWYDFINPQITTFQTEATSMVGQQWTRQVLQNATTNQTLLSNIAQVPQALSPAIGFSQYNLRPFYPYVAIPAVSIGLIYLIIISFFSFSFYLPIHFKASLRYLKPEGHPPLKFYQLIIWRYCATLAAYFSLSLAYSLISLAFQINFSGGVPNSGTETNVTPVEAGNPDAYGHGTFMVYWMLNYLGMIALGLACENVAMVVGQPWTGLWLIFWVITNVSTSFYDITIEPHFYYWGYAWPLHSIVEGSRQILFDLHSRLGLDFGILVAWGAVNTAVFPAACYFMRWKSKHHVHEYYK